MWKVAFIALALLTALGCRERRAVVLHNDDPARPPANLALGPNATDTVVALQFAGRAEWPAYAIGYQIDDAIYFTQSNYDYQMNFDRHNGLFYENQSVETGVWLR